MASADEQLKRLTDPSLLDKIDGLRELNISEYIPLPQVSSFIERENLLLADLSFVESLWSWEISRVANPPFWKVSQISLSHAIMGSALVSRHRYPFAGPRSLA